MINFKKRDTLLESHYVSSILEKIVHHKLGEIEAAKQRIPLAELESRLASVPAPLDFYSALTTGSQQGRVSLIAEVKKASPSKGVIRDDFDPVSIARTYARSGAACISVLTDEHFFQGSLDYLVSIREAVSVPLLRKDFVLDEYQVVEARVAGADGVLLIAECLAPDRLLDLHRMIESLGMTALVELYDKKNIPAVLACQPRLVGVNNRDLNTFEIDLMHSIRVKQALPQGIAMVSESGIFTNRDVELMRDNSVDAILVGESLMRSEDIAAAVKSLIGDQLTR